MPLLVDLMGGLGGLIRFSLDRFAGVPSELFVGAVCCLPTLFLFVLCGEAGSLFWLV